MSDKPPPQAIEAEESILAACLLGGAKEAVGIISWSDFYRTAHQFIFRAMEKIIEAGGPVELPSVVEMLRKVGKLEEAGGVSAISRLIDNVPAAGSVSFYCDVVKDKAAKRKLIEQCNAVMNQCYEDGEPEKIYECARKIATTNIPTLEKQRMVDICNVYDSDRMLSKYRQYVRTLKDNRFITGIHEIDKRIRGVGGGETMFIIARAGAYKTALLMNMMRNYVNASAWCSVFFSLEMPVANIAERYLQMVDHNTGRAIERLYKHRQQEAIEAVERIFKGQLKRLYIVPTKVGLSDISQYVRLIEREHKVKVGLIGIDYLGLLDHPGKDEYDIVSKTARGTKDLSKYLGLPVIVLSQTSRKGGDGKTQVTLDMGRGSGAIEEAADFLLGLWKPENELVCAILKNRKGPVGSMWNLNLNKECFSIGSEATEYKPPQANGKSF